MQIIERVAKPEYWYQPRKLFRRLFGRTHGAGRASVVTAWGLPMEVSLRDGIGAGVAQFGVYDLAVSEVLWRLASGVCLDIGANIGCMTAAMVCGGEGDAEVLAFEPHPVIFQELQANVARWPAPVASRVTLHECAVSSEVGRVTLQIPDDFDSHRGESSLERLPKTGSTSVEVATTTIDELFRSRGIGTVNVAKLDVEGHELAVLQGGHSTLSGHRILHCVFEEHRQYPTPVTERFIAAGYKVFALGKGFRGPELRDPHRTSPTLKWEAASFIASCDPDALSSALAPRGWQFLRAKP